MSGFSPHQVDLWTWRLTPPPEAAQLLLSPQELERAAKFVRPLDRRRFISARTGLRTILAEYLRASPQELVFEENAFGKPQLRQSPSLHFSLSHSAELAALGVSKRAVIGVDVEEPGAFDHADVTEHYFTGGERNAIEVLPPDDWRLAFYRIWTLKEAVVKAIGSGLSTPLHSFEVAADPPRLVKAPADWTAPEEWGLWLNEPGADYVIALATPDGSQGLRVVQRRR